MPFILPGDAARAAGAVRAGQRATTFANPSMPPLRPSVDPAKERDALYSFASAERL